MQFVPLKTFLATACERIYASQALLHGQECTIRERSAEVTVNVEAATYYVEFRVRAEPVLGPDGAYRGKVEALTRVQPSEMRSEDTASVAALLRDFAELGAKLEAEFAATRVDFG